MRIPNGGNSQKWEGGENVVGILRANRTQMARKNFQQKSPFFEVIHEGRP